MTAEENIATIRRMYQALNKRDLNIVYQFLAPGFIRYDLAGAFEEIKGAEGIPNLLQIFFKALPDLQITIEDIFATEKWVAVRYAVSGTHQGEFVGITPTGKKVKFSGITHYRFEEGKIVESWNLIDVAGFMRQVGALNT